MNDDSTAMIVASLRTHIAASTPGTRLPSTRALVAEHRSSPVTVQRALRVLAAEGVLESRPGVGTFVRSAPTAKAHDYGWQTTTLGARTSTPARLPGALTEAANDVISLHGGYPDGSLLPERLVRSALARAGRGPTALVRPPVAGLPGLQTWFAAELSAATAPGNSGPTAADVVIVPGSQAGLSSILRAVGGGGRAVAMESPTYWGAIAAARHAGVTVVPVRSSATGPDPADVDRVLAESGARVFYAQPTWANPTGAQWSPQRSQDILDVVRSHGAFLIEDDWAHDFGIDAPARPLAGTDDSGHVIYLRSLTKSVSPAVRVAAVIARGPVRGRILADHTGESMYVSGVLQSAAFDVVTAPAWSTHVRRTREHLRARRDLLAGALRSHAPEAAVDAIPSGGLSLWVRLPEGSDAGDVASRCQDLGVMVGAGDDWFPTEPSGPHLRLTYCGADPGRYEEGASILGEVLRDS
ncbi:PLP-dependent aminotransferase family protein [Knoellia sp. S7-12]|uniref:aminotransferase-like domain-containing protein n=1 Tax=Knoellia sp. S7-12 TaxID=3126698 RepID=UPI003367B9DE